MRGKPPPPGTVVKYHLPKMRCDYTGDAPEPCENFAVVAVISQVTGNLFGYCRTHLFRVLLFGPNQEQLKEPNGGA